MKPILILCVFILIAFYMASGQTTNLCSNINVITPIVAKPSQDNIVSATCTLLTVGWTGSSNQNYEAMVLVKNPSTGLADTTFGTSITCDGSQNCTAIFPVVPNSIVNWSVQARQDMNGRSFYSYIVRGQRDFHIPDCLQPPHRPAQETYSKPAITSNPKRGIIKEELVLHPNPAANNIQLNWSGGYQGVAKIMVIDGTGKTTMLLNITKQKSLYSKSVDISALSPGLYYVIIRGTNSLSITGKFLKL